MATPGKKSRAPKKKKPRTRSSSTGRVVNVPAVQDNWRRKLMTSRIKFDDEVKQVYINELALHGMKGAAAKVAGISMQSVYTHIENDPDFAEAVAEACEAYRDLLANEVRRRGLDGWKEPVYNKDGRVFEPLLNEDGHLGMQNPSTGEVKYFLTREMADEEGFTLQALVPAFIRKFSDRMLELDIKRVDPSYREKSTLDLNTAGGVMVAPAEMTPEDWIEQEMKENANREPPPGALEEGVEE